MVKTSTLSNTVVELLPHYPKVNGLCPATVAGTKRKKLAGKQFFKHFTLKLRLHGRVMRKLVPVV